MKTAWFLTLPLVALCHDRLPVRRSRDVLRRVLTREDDRCRTEHYHSETARNRASRTANRPQCCSMKICDKGWVLDLVRGTARSLSTLFLHAFLGSNFFVCYGFRAFFKRPHGFFNRFLYGLCCSFCALRDHFFLRDAFFSGRLGCF